MERSATHIILVAMSLAYTATAASAAPVSQKATTITLDFNSLPSAQGWTYVAIGQEVPEARVFSVRGGVLHQNSIGVGIGYPGTNAYRLANVIDPSQPFTISMRARVRKDEGAVTVNSFGFCAAAYGGTEEFGFGLGTHLTQTVDAYGRGEALAFDNTKFHDYRLEVTPGVGYQLFRDDVLITTGVPLAMEFPNGLELGDGTGGANARAEVASYTFSQGAVPEPGSLTFLCLVGASLLLRRTWRGDGSETTSVDRTDDAISQ